MTNIQKQSVDRYCNQLGLTPIYIESIFHLFRLCKCVHRAAIVISPYRCVRGVAGRFLNKRVADSVGLAKEARLYYAEVDALTLLAQKNIPVYFYNRIGIEKSGFIYSSTAQRRMNKGLNFPKLYENIESFADDLKELFGDLYSREYVEEIGKIPQVIQKGSVYCHEDKYSKYVNVVEGKRITCYQPSNSFRTLHIYGRCGAFGYAVEDKDTLPSQIQKLLVERGIGDIRVVNHGLWGGSDEYIDHNFIEESVGMMEGDIVLFYRMHIDKNLLKEWENKGVWYKEITHEWHQFSESKWCFYDKPGHMNSIGYRITAKLIVDDLIAHSFTAKPVAPVLFTDFKSENLTAYLKDAQVNTFTAEIKTYTDNILKKHPLSDHQNNNGSIVMNCNPFTFGHRYLIELAAKNVDLLFIFVVEEDKSFFKYQDRFEMIRKGTSDIPNVIVVPSGKFIISSFTFPEYFMKDYVKEKNFDVSMDVETFCKYIAPPLCIKKRFAGEEPFDPVTKNYNENMARILPSYGMEFCEIPRFSIEPTKVISATEVRKLLKENNLEEIKKYVPESTMSVLSEKYI